MHCLALTCSQSNPLVAHYGWSYIFNINPKPTGSTYYVLKPDVPATLTLNTRTAAYVVQDFDGNELNAPKRVLPGSAYRMAASEAGAAGSTFDIFVGKSDQSAGTSIAHTVATVMDVKYDWKRVVAPY